MNVKEELEKLDAEWETERQQYLITDRAGRQHVPEPKGAAVFARAAQRSYLMGILTAIVGIVWTFMSFQLTRNSNIFVQIILPAFGILFVALGLPSSMRFSRTMQQFQYNYLQRMQQYRQAYKAYQTRREEILKGSA